MACMGTYFLKHCKVSICVILCIDFDVSVCGARVFVDFNLESYHVHVKRRHPLPFPTALYLENSRENTLMRSPYNPRDVPPELSGKPLSWLEAHGRDLADQLIKCLKTTPALDPSFPCSFVAAG